MQRHVVVYAPAPIGVGQPIEVNVMKVVGVPGICVRDLTTGIVYGGGGIFLEATAADVIDGHKSDFRRGRPRATAKLESSYRGRVVECVVANVSQHEGAAPCTSFVIDVDEGAAPYRS